MVEQKSICKNCSNLFTGKYCNSCGEKLYTRHDKSIAHIFSEGFHFLTHFEGSFFITIKTILKSPGKFSADYCNGIRKKYFKPVSLFFFFVVLYLLFPRFHGLNMKLDTYVTEKYRFTWASVPLVTKKMKTKNVSYAEVAKMYDSKSSSVSKVGLFFLIPFCAGFTLLLFFNSKKQFFDHFIISTELSALYIGLHFLAVPFLSFIAELISKDWLLFFRDDNEWLLYGLLFADLIIVSVAFKKFYAQKWIWTILKAFAYLVIFNFIVLYFYGLMVLVATLLLL